jgi:hypothetical protein
MKRHSVGALLSSSIIDRQVDDIHLAMLYCQFHIGDVMPMSFWAAGVIFTFQLLTLELDKRAGIENILFCTFFLC